MLNYSQTKIASTLYEENSTFVIMPRSIFPKRKKRLSDHVLDFLKLCQ